MANKEYEKCPFCGHSEWHKTFGCDDVCCSGCPGDNGDCDCQYTQADIKRELERENGK